MTSIEKQKKIQAEGIGKRLRGLREVTNLSVRAFAKEYGVSYSLWSDYENDRRKPNATTIEKLCGNFGVKSYGRPDFQALEPREVDASPPDLTLTVAELRTTNKRLRDKIARLENIIQDELSFWKRGLDSGDWETREQLKRRMSRLRGAVEYLGTETGWRVNP